MINGWRKPSGDKDKYGIILNQMQDRIKDEILKDIINKPDYDVFLAYSAYHTDDDGNPIDNLDEIAVPGRAVVIASGYKSGILVDATWLDLSVVGDEMIKKTGDFHHVFLEGVQVERDDNGTKICWLVMGS